MLSAAQSSSHAPRERGAAADDASSVQLIAFTVGEETYGVEITAVREIRAWSGVTALPNTAPFVRGVINLRGTIVPVIDLKSRFNQGSADPGKTHVVIVLAIGARWVGILVDAVSDILTVTAADIHPVPDVTDGADSGLLSGIVTHEERMVSLVRIEKLLAGAVVN
jgi:purine-binding chemotaxis protein CheW